MSYKKADEILPDNLIELIQKYIDGEYIYIPRKKHEKKTWGTNTNIKQELQNRNSQIYIDYVDGVTSRCLAERYYLSLKSIQRIILHEKRKHNATI